MNRFIRAAVAGTLVCLGALLHGEPAAPSADATPLSPSQALPRKAAAPPVAASAEDIKPLAPGTAAPNPAVKTPAGESVPLASALGPGVTMVIFYRGGWCPYCNTHLGEIAGMADELAERGVTVLALSPDSPEKLADAKPDANAGYTLLSDSAFEAAKAFGVAFRVDDETNAKLKGYGIALGEWSGNDSERVLPVPAVFLVDANGTIQFTHTNPDYRRRLSPSELRVALDAHGAPRP
jgi:peroxiredoxin